MLSSETSFAANALVGLGATDAVKVNIPVAATYKCY